MIKALSATQPSVPNAPDRVVVYFAGHGQTVGAANPTGYLMPRGGDPTASATGISMQDLVGWMENYPARYKLLLVDACYSGLVLTRAITRVDRAPAGAPGASSTGIWVTPGAGCSAAPRRLNFHFGGADFEGCAGRPPCLRWFNPDGPRPLVLQAWEGEPWGATFGYPGRLWEHWPDPEARDASFIDGVHFPPAATYEAPRPWTFADGQARGTQTLYAVAFTVAPGREVAASPQVPFNFAQAWSSPGDGCDAQSLCVSPRRPLVCRDETCQVPCASDAACADAIACPDACATPQRCGAVRGDGIRYCEDLR